MILNPVCAGGSPASWHPEWKQRREIAKRFCFFITDPNVIARALLSCEEEMLTALLTHMGSRILLEELKGKKVLVQSSLYFYSSTLC